QDYSRYVSYKLGFMGLAFVGLILGLAVSLSLGAGGVPLSVVARTLLGISVSKRFDMIVWNIRMPQALAAIVAGAGLSVAGAAMQSIARHCI
ncbi:MAG: iron chelate uptake ABC transporter family permease subunit, partial [Deltaproteobacteria bacterium]